MNLKAGKDFCFLQVNIATNSLATLDSIAKSYDNHSSWTGWTGTDRIG